MVWLGFEPGLQDGRCTRIHWAMAAPQILLFMCCSFILIYVPTRRVNKILVCYQTYFEKKYFYTFCRWWCGIWTVWPDVGTKSSYAVNFEKSIIIIQICPLKARKSKLLSVFDSCDELAKKYSRLDCFFAVRKCTFKLWWNCSGVSSAESDNQSLKLRSLPWRSFPEIITSVHKVKKTKKRNRQLSQKLDKKRWQIKLNRIKFCLCSKIYFLNKESLLLWLFSTRKHFENHARHETVFELFYFGIMTS